MVTEEEEEGEESTRKGRELRFVFSPSFIRESSHGRRRRRRERDGIDD